MTFSPSVDFVPAQPPREPGYVDEIRGALKEIEENLDENKQEQKELRKVCCVIVIIMYIYGHANGSGIQSLKCNRVLAIRIPKLYTITFRLFF